MDGAERYAEIPLDHIPESLKVTKTFGFQWGIWGGFLIVVLCLMLAGSTGLPGVFQIEIYVSLLVVGGSFIAWELVRRRNPTVLVRQGGMVGVYRKGRCDIVVACEQIRCEKIDLVIVLKIGAPLLICTVLFVAVAAAIIQDEKRITADTVIMLSFGLALGASLASAAWTTFFRKHLRVPVKGSRWLAEETVLVTREQCRDLLSGPGAD
jgi:hypothetical protein